ncbi:MAG: EamA family transporter [Granulosicoccus sp.]|nr:EamA family transporter [Granulosicoccus sp.]
MAAKILDSNTLRGLMWMFLSTIGFSVSHLIVRMVSPEIHSAQSVFFRGVFGLVVLSPWIFRRGIALFKTKDIKLHLIRALFSFSSISCFYHALTIIPLAKATAIGLLLCRLGRM